jgi:hypothetical protein
MADITKNINALHPVNRMIYAYTTPNDRSHDGWVKVGDTEVDSGELPKDAVADRVKQQTHTVDAETKLEWYGPAKFDDNLEPFRDHDLHKYLSGPKGIEQKPHTEWFRTSPLTAKGAYYEFRENHGVLVQLDGVQEYVLRDEQKDAVEKTLTKEIHNSKTASSRNRTRNLDLMRVAVCICWYVKIIPTALLSVCLICHCSSTNRIPLDRFSNRLPLDRFPAFLHVYLNFCLQSCGQMLLYMHP